ncbi:MAG: hypothetical protein FWE92_01640 [Defluviitaleaceae bacterium]|nr:hypothetical protein [Defluviitaleaceae bacterium]
MISEKVGKRILTIVQILLLMGIGFFAGWNGWFDTVVGIAALVVISAFIVIVFDGIKKRLWPMPKSTAEEPEPRTKMIISTILKVAMGMFFTYGTLGAVFALIAGRESGFAFYITLIAISVVILAVLLNVRFVQDKETVEVTKEMKYYGKDERLKAIQYKAGYVTFGITLMLMLCFGAYLSVFPPYNFNVIPAGILIITVLAVVSFITMFTLYDGGKLDAESSSTRGAVTMFVISLVPPILMGVRWVTAGLTNIGIAFFAVFVGVAVLSAWSLWFEKKYK